MSRIKVLIQHKLDQNSDTPRFRPTAIIMGRTGAGKTTLFNNLCGTNNQSGAGAGSVTRRLHRNPVSCGENTFNLIDTPGINSSTETYKHAYLLRKALTSTELNTIFIVTKYESRFDTMLENCYETERPVYNYDKNIVVMVSHWDHSENPQNDYEEICKLFTDYCTNIIFYSGKSWSPEVAGFMYDCISNMNSIKITITDEDFFLKFNVAEIKLQMKDSLNQYRKTAQLLFDDYSEAVIFAKSQRAEELDEILHMLIVEFKNEMEILLEKFQNEHGIRMQELDFYTFYIKMEGENLERCDEFVKKVVSFMSYNLFDNKDPRNLIKKCPACGLIWFKTEGCDGLTNCGNKQFHNYFDQRSQPFSKYELQRVNGKLRWAKLSYEKKLLIAPQNRVTSNGVGCGKRFVWAEQPKLEDELILELFKVKTIEQAKQLIQAGNFKEARLNYERSIDSTFHC